MRSDLCCRWIWMLQWMEWLPERLSEQVLSQPQFNDKIETKQPEPSQTFRLGRPAWALACQGWRRIQVWHLWRKKTFARIGLILILTSEKQLAGQTALQRHVKLRRCVLPMPRRWDKSDKKSKKAESCQTMKNPRCIFAFAIASVLNHGACSTWCKITHKCDVFPLVKPN